MIIGDTTTKTNKYEAPLPPKLYRYLILSTIALPTLLSASGSDWGLPAFSPRQIIDSHNLFPFIIAPWAGPTALSGTLSRLIQATILWHSPVTETTFIYGYGFWVAIALARTTVAYLLSRSVGWAFPRLFSHYAVYETSSGYGPMVMAMLLTMDTTELSKLGNSIKQRYIFVILLSIAMCWMDDEPWTYGITVLLTIIYILTCSILHHAHSKGRLPVPVNQQTKDIATRRRMINKSAVIIFMSIAIPYKIIHLAPPPLVLMPESPFPPTRLLDIIALSYPRSDVKASSQMLQATIDSFLTLRGPEVTLSIFTHAEDHPAFDQVQASHGELPHVVFFKDVDSHPDSRSGQYLHLAEAFRWQLIRDAGQGQAEWVMIIEDDFPICGGERGLNALRTVMRMLEDGRVDGNRIPKRRGAFIGTGGSGLIFHHSLLPILIHILKTHAEITSKLPPNMPTRPADVVMQDCLLGRDPLCPPSQPGGLIITSRLILDHLGGMYSTNKQKAQNSDKWRCGWRHPFHGIEEVDVVVVDVWTSGM